MKPTTNIYALIAGLMPRLFGYPIWLAGFIMVTATGCSLFNHNKEETARVVQLVEDTKQWDKTQTGSDSAKYFIQYLERFPYGKFSHDAAMKLDQIQPRFNVELSDVYMFNSSGRPIDRQLNLSLELKVIAASRNDQSYPEVQKARRELAQLQSSINSLENIIKRDEELYKRSGRRNHALLRRIEQYEIKLQNHKKRMEKAQKKLETKQVQNEYYLYDFGLAPLTLEIPGSATIGRDTAVILINERAQDISMDFRARVQIEGTSRVINADAIGLDEMFIMRGNKTIKQNVNFTLADNIEGYLNLVIIKESWLDHYRAKAKAAGLEPTSYDTETAEAVDEAAEAEAAEEAVEE